jgi:flagellar basal body-associated protein FliL
VTFQQNQNVQRASQSRAIALSILIVVVVVFVIVIFLKPIWLLQLRTFTHRFRGSFGHLHGKGRDRAHQTIVSALRESLEHAT